MKTLNSRSYERKDLLKNFFVKPLHILLIYLIPNNDIFKIQKKIMISDLKVPYLINNVTFIH